MVFTVLFTDRNGATRGAEADTLADATEAAWQEWSGGSDEPDDPATVQIFESGNLVVFFGARQSRLVVFSVDDDERSEDEWV